MAKLTEYELEREANIARNRALLADLEIKEAVAGLGIPATKPRAPDKVKAKPIQSAKRVKRVKSEDVAPRRQSARLKKLEDDPNETPRQKRKREEEQRVKETEEQLEREAKERWAKKPRHHDIDLVTLAEGDAEDGSTITELLKGVAPSPRRVAQSDAFVFTENRDAKDKAAVEELREKLQNLKIVARARVTHNRIYCGAYHPEVSKDLIFFGEKHGQLGIWDARAPPDEVSDGDGEVLTPDQEMERGKYWRLQLHWPASSQSSISCIKLDPIDSHSVYTSAYDCTVRSLNFTSGVSREIFSTGTTLINSIDLTVTGHEMWISDAGGGLTHLDLREDKSKARWYALSRSKIGSVSINPTNPQFLLTASNTRALRLWDTRKLATIAEFMSDDSAESLEFDADVVDSFLDSEPGRGVLRAEYPHNQSATAAFWDPRGRGIVSTSYDNTLRLWDVDPAKLKDDGPPSFQPFSQISHNCQTGKWVTLLKAQWSLNPDVYPHFTIGNMARSLDIFSCKGDVIARLEDPSRITAVQAVTCSHPNIVERAVSGNASGRCALWAPPEL